MASAFSVLPASVSLASPRTLPAVSLSSVAVDRRSDTEGFQPDDALKRISTRAARHMAAAIGIASSMHCPFFQPLMQRRRQQANPTLLDLTTIKHESRNFPGCKSNGAWQHASRLCEVGDPQAERTVPMAPRRSNPSPNPDRCRGTAAPAGLFARDCRERGRARFARPRWVRKVPIPAESSRRQSVLPCRAAARSGSTGCTSLCGRCAPDCRS